MQLCMVDFSNKNYNIYLSCPTGLSLCKQNSEIVSKTEIEEIVLYRYVRKYLYKHPL